MSFQPPLQCFNPPCGLTLARIRCGTMHGDGHSPSVSPLSLLHVTVCPLCEHLVPVSVRTVYMPKTSVCRAAREHRLRVGGHSSRSTEQGKWAELERH
jgi:hypothetical protein